MFTSGWYMSSTTSIPKSALDVIGFIQHIAHGQRKSIYRTLMDKGCPWCLDNSVFTEKFDHAVWIEKLEILKPYTNTCLFVVAPDVVGNRSRTYWNFEDKYKDILKQYAYPIAYVAQDGEKLGTIPWADIDCLFIGGTDDFKFSQEVYKIIFEAKRRKKWVHVGRVNSIKRLRCFWLADSWDGTTLSIEPRGYKKIAAEVRLIRHMKNTPQLI